MGRLFHYSDLLLINLYQALQNENQEVGVKIKPYQDLVCMVNKFNPAAKVASELDANQTQKSENLHILKNYFKSDL